MEKEIEKLRKQLAISVAKECKCKNNISVNHDLVKRNLKYKKALELIANRKVILRAMLPIAKQALR